MIKMSKTIWTFLFLVSLFFVSTESKRGGKSGGSGRSGSNRSPSDSGNTGSNWNPSYSGGSSHNTQWKNDKSSDKINAGSAATGAITGYVLGRASSNMKYKFDNDMDDQYYNTYRRRMPNQVYKPQYTESYVSQDRFVSDCFNTTITKYVKPNEGKNTTEDNETEVRVTNTIIRELCVTEYKSSPEYYNYVAYNPYNSGMKMICSSNLIFSITLFVYFMVQ